MTDSHTILFKKVFAFVGIWQGVVIPSVPEVTEWMKFTSAGLGVLIGLITIYKQLKNDRKK